MCVGFCVCDTIYNIFITLIIPFVCTRNVCIYCVWVRLHFWIHCTKMKNKSITYLNRQDLG